jgi:hypothetical protein
MDPRLRSDTVLVVWVVRLAPAALMAVAGLGAPQPGTYVEGGGGLGAYHYSGGCDGPHNYANFVAVQARVRHREPNGLVFAGEVAGQRDEVVRSDGSTPEVGRTDTFGVVAARIGFEGRYVGIEVGPGILRGGVGENRHRPSTSLVPSLKFWAGRYGVAHGWVAALADQTLPTSRLFGFGVGHASDRLRASVGLAGSGGQDGTVIADADVAIGDGFWLGAGAQFTDNRDTWGLLGRLGFFWGNGDAAAARQPPAPVEETSPVEPPAAPPPVPQPVVAPEEAPSVEIEAPGVDAGA